MNMKKKLMAIAAAAAVTAMPVTAWGATGTKISSVSLRIDSEIEAGEYGGDVDVTTSSGKFSVEETEITNEPDDEWEDGDKPKLKITLYADDDYYFASGFSKGSVTISGDDGTVTSVSRSSSDTLIVYVTLDALDGDDSDYDLDADGLEWDESDGTAVWDDSSDAKRYEVQLYRGSSLVTSVLTTYTASYDFSGYITQSGYYKFRVRGVYSSSVKGSWEESDSWYVSSDEAASISSGSSSYGTGSTPGTGSGYSSGAWLKDENGWWYCNADKSYTVANWQYINDTWYYFDEYGYMKTGWIQWNAKWYYCGDDGAMLSDTVTPDGYYVDADGVWVQ